MGQAVAAAGLRHLYQHPHPHPGPVLMRQAVAVAGKSYSHLGLYSGPALTEQVGQAAVTATTTTHKLHSPPLHCFYCDAATGGRFSNAGFFTNRAASQSVTASSPTGSHDGSSSGSGKGEEKEEAWGELLYNGSHWSIVPPTLVGSVMKTLYGMCLSAEEMANHNFTVRPYTRAEIAQKAICYQCNCTCPLHPSLTRPYILTFVSRYVYRYTVYSE